MDTGNMDFDTVAEKLLKGFDDDRTDCVGSVLFAFSTESNQCKCGMTGKEKIRGKWYCHNCARKKLEGW